MISFRPHEDILNPRDKNLSHAPYRCAYERHGTSNPCAYSHSGPACLRAATPQNKSRSVVCVADMSLVRRLFVSSPFLFCFFEGNVHFDRFDARMPVFSGMRTVVTDALMHAVRPSAVAGGGKSRTKSARSEHELEKAPNGISFPFFFCLVLFVCLPRKTTRRRVCAGIVGFCGIILSVAVAVTVLNSSGKVRLPIKNQSFCENLGFHYTASDPFFFVLSFCVPTIVRLKMIKLCLSSLFSLLFFYCGRREQTNKLDVSFLL